MTDELGESIFTQAYNSGGLLPCNEDIINNVWYQLDVYSTKKIGQCDDTTAT